MTETSKLLKRNIFPEKGQSVESKLEARPLPEYFNVSVSHKRHKENPKSSPRKNTLSTNELKLN